MTACNSVAFQLPAGRSAVVQRLDNFGGGAWAESGPGWYATVFASDGGEMTIAGPFPRAVEGVFFACLDGVAP